MEDLTFLFKEKLAKIEGGTPLSAGDSLDVTAAIRRFQIQFMPNTLGDTTFEGSGHNPAASVPLSTQGILAAIERASIAEDAIAKRNAMLIGTVISIFIGAGVTLATGGAVPPSVLTSAVTTLKPILGSSA